MLDHSLIGAASLPCAPWRRSVVQEKVEGRVKQQVFADLAYRVLKRLGVDPDRLQDNPSAQRALSKRDKPAAEGKAWDRRHGSKVPGFKGSIQSENRLLKFCVNREVIGEVRVDPAEGKNRDGGMRFLVLSNPGKRDAAPQGHRVIDEVP